MGAGGWAASINAEPLIPDAPQVPEFDRSVPNDVEAEDDFNADLGVGGKKTRFTAWTRAETLDEFYKWWPERTLHLNDDSGKKKLP